jgi:divalent metal cation (Fe/Co/Zn/Cd) transporter
MSCHNALSMASILPIAARDTIRRIQRIQVITIIWMSVEAAVSLSAAWIARSPALLAFGGDSAIELLSAAVVLWRFRAQSVQEHPERRAARIAGALLFVLAAYVVTASALTLLGYSEPQPTYLGIAILIAAAAIMPWLAKEKQELSAATASAALRADSAQSALCAYLSLIALVGLGVNAIWHVAWADPVAALVVTPLIVWEGREAIRGKSCGCC